MHTPIVKTHLTLQHITLTVTEPMELPRENDYDLEMCGQLLLT